MARWVTALRRVAFALVALWLVVSSVWLVIMLTPDPQVAMIRFGAQDDPDTEVNEVEQAVHRYLESRDRTGPLTERYANWAGDFLTFDWGVSYSQGVSVTTALAEGIPNTLRYVVPSLLLAVVFGTAIGMYAALVPDSRLARLASQFVYFGSGLPNFYLAVIVPVLLSIPLELLGSGLPSSFGPIGTYDTILPIFVLTLALLGSQIRYARTEALEYARRDFVRLVRAKGAGPARIALHILRNAALPLLTLFVADVLAVLVVDVFVLEYVFPIQGLGSMAYSAIFDRDTPLVVGITTVVVATGLLGTLLQDLSYLYLDPRVGRDQ